MTKGMFKRTEKSIEAPHYLSSWWKTGDTAIVIKLEFQELLGIIILIQLFVDNKAWHHISEIIIFLRK